MINRKNVDMASRIIDQIWRNKDSLVFGNALMRLFEYKRIVFPSSSSDPIKLKRIGKEVFHHMSIYVKDNLWYANDGAHYLHERHRARNVPFGTSSLAALEGGLKSTPELETEPLLEFRPEPSNATQPPQASDIGTSGLKEIRLNLDLEQLKSVMRETMKEEISDLVRKTIKDEISVLQKSDAQKLEAMELKIKESSETLSAIKKNSEKMLTDLHNYRLLYDDFSTRVRKDLSNNVVGFDNFVSQMRKIGESVTTSFKTLDSKTDKTSQAVTNLHGEIKLFLSTRFPDYIRSGPHIIDLEASTEKPSPTKPSTTTSTSRTTRSRKYYFFYFLKNSSCKDSF